MLFPRFTIRTALAIVTAFSVLFLIAGMAYRGNNWAWGVTIGVVSLLFTALVHAGWFAIVWLFGRFLTDEEIPGDQERLRSLQGVVGDPPLANSARLGPRA